MNLSTALHALSDKLLLDEIGRLAASERAASAALIAAIAEFDKRRLYLPLGYSCLFTYCTDVLHLSEGAAFNRIEVARASRRFPQLLTLLEEGALSLTSIRLLSPHLTEANFDETVQSARHLKKEALKLLIARLNPQPPVPAVIRKLPEPKAIAPVEATLSVVAPSVSVVAPPALTPPSRRPVVAPLSEAHYKLQVTISTLAHDRLRNIQDLMRHANPTGDAAVIVERALEVLEADLLKKKAAEVIRPRAPRNAAGDAKGRHIPASVMRAVWRRDQARCAFVGDGGRECGATRGLEFHHVQPFAVGGPATVSNIELRCRAHNRFEWERHLDDETAALASR